MGKIPQSEPLSTEEMSLRGRFAVVIPIYNHAGRVGSVIEKTRQLGLPIIVVNDGSTDETPQVLEKIENITVLHHPENRGKGAALRTGFAEAAKIADYAITIDADDQLKPSEAYNLIRAIEPGERALVVGRRDEMLDNPDVPWTSRNGRRFSNFWIFLSGGPMISDSQCGFRIYPLAELLPLKTIGSRFQFEVEILILARWLGIKVKQAPVSVDYNERISHFRPFIDFVRIVRVVAIRLLTRVFIPHPVRMRLIMQTPEASEQSAE